ncbi:MAG: hypothetical protein GX799_12135 [Crenarchaeota archaeon]|nr:hypothetical protein [Thermoproteota archaeon]
MKNTVKIGNSLETILIVDTQRILGRNNQDMFFYTKIEGITSSNYT